MARAFWQPTTHNPQPTTRNPQPATRNPHEPGRLPTHRELRHHRQSPDRGAGGDARVHRLPFLPLFRLAHGLRRAARPRQGRLLPDRPAAGSGQAEATLPARFQHPAHPLPRSGRRGGDQRLHARVVASAGRGRGKHPDATRPPRQDGARRDPLPRRVRAALRLRADHAHGGPDLGEGNHLQRAGRRPTGAAAAFARRARAPRERRRRGGVHPARGRDGGVRAGGSAPRRAIRLRRGALRPPRLQGHGELLAHVDGAQHVQRAAGARPSTVPP